MNSTKAEDQHNELKKWARRNPVPDITDEEENVIDDFVLDVFERNVEKTMESIQKKKVDLVQKDAEFIRRILDAWAYRWKSEFDESMSEATYTATWIAPDFEVLKNKEPSLFISSWCEMIHPSSKWRRRNVYKSNKKTGRKCDGILFENNSKIERLVFENVCSPGKTKLPKYHRDLNKSFRNAVDTLCKRFWTNRRGDAEISRKYVVLTYIVHKNKGELWRVCLAGKDKCLAEKVYELEVPRKFEDDWIKLADICKMMLLIERIFRHNDDVYHDYTKSIKKKNIVRVEEWLSLNSNSPQKKIQKK
ncbi:hypothetical protein RclHR1_16970003 [Rhizophagus clarus]|uniref:Uncharacterized protein n=1 Tax=Rhizophagus clarus TaxID=94130 RepID=A0A2Z6QZD8_9GLOM|nr:hypothetical protein RclHR1_16970003 [Rhizophagus clarus]